jgi:prepilin-type N-terminal cleavage/methylation domain-containing protein
VNRLSFNLRTRLRRGFSLLELMVVVVIMGVVGAMSAGRIHALIVQQRVTRAASVVQNDIETAFLTAGRNRRPVRIAWNSASMTLDVTDRAGTRVYRRTGLGRDPYGLTPGAVSFSRSPIEIFPTGLANDSLVITFNLETVTKRVRVSRAGLVRVE